jgi:hypothetical protein
LSLPRLRYLPLERLPIRRPVDRFAWLRAACRRRRVLDLGAFDESQVDRPQHASWRWLHAELAAVAAEILGVDCADKVREAGEITTAAGTRIVYGVVEELDDVVAEFRPEVIVAGEVIEHTRDPLGWISRLSTLAPGARFIATTPNATSIVNVILCWLRRENTDRGHLHIYSYKTLATLAARVGLADAEILPYYYHSHLMRGRSPHILVPLVYAADYGILTPLQWLFPLTAGGWILDGRLAKV